MKLSRLPLLLTLAILASLLLTSCTGASPVNTWPGLSAGDGVVYLAYQTGVFAVNVNNGSMKWRFPAKPENGKTFFAPPVLDNEQLYVGDYSNTLYNLNPSDGSPNWTFVEEGGHFAASPLAVGDTVLAPSSDYNLYALDRSGNLRWEFGTENLLWAQPASDGELVFLPAMDHSLYALRLSDGSPVWQRDLGSAMLNAPLLEDGVLYVDTLDGQLFALQASSGEILWNTEKGEQVWARPVLHEGILYYGTSAGNVFAVSADPEMSGQVIWQQALGSPVIGAGVLISDGLVFVTEGGLVQGLSFEGETLWNQTVNGKLYTTPVVVDDTVVVAVTEGDALLIAFNLEGGQKWIFTAPQ